MKPEIVHEVIFSATPYEIFESLIDETKHGKFTKATAKIERKVGGKFSVFNGDISGKILKMKKNKLIMQKWRGSDWPKDHYSEVTFSLKPLEKNKRTLLTLVHSNVPDKNRAEIDKGWKKYYWEPLEKFLRQEKTAPVSSFMEEFKNKHNLKILYKICTKNCKFHLPVRGLPSTVKGQINIGKTIFEAFPDVHVSLQDLIVEGDRVVERHMARATHRGEFYGIPATGKKIFWTENHIYRIEKGKIAEVWSEASFHDLLKQISN